MQLLHVSFTHNYVTIYLATTFTSMHAGAEFSVSLHNVAVRAEREDGSIPGARLTWSTTAPSECVASFAVKVRTIDSGSVFTVYTTSETEFILTGLQCHTTYYFRVVITGVRTSLGIVESQELKMFVGGKGHCMCDKSCTIYTGGT